MSDEIGTLFGAVIAGVVLIAFASTIPSLVPSSYVLFGWLILILGAVGIVAAVVVTLMNAVS